jgi:hypothetical protein
MFSKIKDAMASNRLVIEKIIENGIAEKTFRPVDVRMTIASIMGSITLIATSPSKVIDTPDFDINDKAQGEVLRKRLITHLQDLVITHLTPQK